MRLGTIACLLGVLLLQLLRELPQPWWLAAGVVAALLMWRVRVLRFPALVMAGFLWALWRATLALEPGLVAELEGADVQVRGCIASIPQARGQATRFLFDVEALEHQGHGAPNPGRVRLGWYRDAPMLRAGDCWRLTVRLKRPRGFMNPGGFDYEAWLYQRGIAATGYVVARHGHERQGRGTGVRHAILRLRERLAHSVSEALGERPGRGVIVALIVGEQAALAPAQWEVLRRTGTTHLMAISGLHIGLVAGLVLFPARRLWAIFPRAILALPASQAAMLAALLAATAYAALAGFSIPTRRALIMLAVGAGALWWRRALTPSHALAAALFAVLLIDPAAVHAAGFWLSFAAVAFILYAFAGRRVAVRGWRAWGRVQMVVTLGLLPLTLVAFQCASLIAPAANLVAIPWIGFLVIPLALLGAMLLEVHAALGALVVSFACTAVEWLWWLLDAAAQPGWAQWEKAVAQPWSMLAGMGGIVLLCAPRGLPARWLGVPLLLPMLLNGVAPPPPQAFRFTLLDVGQGLAAVVQTHRHVAVFDTGPRFNDDFDTGAAVLLPFLRAQGIGAVDLLVVSHGDNDHIGGAESLRNAIVIREMVSSVPDRLAPGRAQACRAGQHWTWDGVELLMLHPAQASAFEGNDGSCVLRVQGPGGTVLLTADIERDAEAALGLQWGRDLRADVLVAPHHGSATSSTEAFIDLVQPRYVLFPVGYRNMYGFPKAAVGARYRDAGALAYDSARHGAITFEFPVTGPVGRPDTWRQRARRYWNAP